VSLSHLRVELIITKETLTAELELAQRMNSTFYLFHCLLLTMGNRGDMHRKLIWRIQGMLMGENILVSNTHFAVTVVVQFNKTICKKYDLSIP
jgi:hypothetical protein